MRTMTRAAIAVIAVTSPLLVTTPAQAAPIPRDYVNCTALNKVYPHGVGLVGARDRTSGRPITGFARAPKVYYLNDESDADRDRIACEKA